MLLSILEKKVQDALAEYREDPDEGGYMVLKNLININLLAIYPLLSKVLEEESESSLVRENLAMLVAGHYPDETAISMLVHDYEWPEEDFQDMSGFDRYCRLHGTPYTKEQRAQTFLDTYAVYKKFPQPDSRELLENIIGRDPESVRDIALKTLASENDAKRHAVLKEVLEEYLPNESADKGAME